ncbi:lipid-A-disaccharide synthase [Gemmata sp.]|uniref:lipid-A-disaccharide synthase n=1 Tax=Gemmata sp. TaxID=1914242 RepID=UPI003F715722
MKLFLSAGEPSGDLHGANLIRALRRRDPEIEVAGFGGPKMAAAGASLHYPLTELSVMGLRRVLEHLPTFFRLAADSERLFRDDRPDAVVLIDYPGFNFELAKRARAAGIPVYYFVPPQLWAWRRGRARQVRKWCAGVLSALPFEDDWYRARGVRTHYVGHPYFDELANQRLDPAFLADERVKGGAVVALLPGSRNQEVAANFEMMLAAARKVKAARPDARFLVAAFNDRHAAQVREAAARAAFPVSVHVGRTPEVIELADACVAVSGSVSLELMYRAKPSVVVYRMAPLSLWLARRLVKLPYFTLVNLLAGEALFPEIATARDESERIAGHVLGWLNNPAARDAAVARLAALRDRVAVPGACERAADFLLGEPAALRRAA